MNRNDKRKLVGYILLLIVSALAFVWGMVMLLLLLSQTGCSHYHVDLVETASAELQVSPERCVVRQTWSGQSNSFAWADSWTLACDEKEYVCERKCHRFADCSVRCKEVL